MKCDGGILDGDEGPEDVVVVVGHLLTAPGFEFCQFLPDVSSG